MGWNIFQCWFINDKTVKKVINIHLSGLEIVRCSILMCVRASVVLMQCTLTHHVKFVRASCVKFHTLPNSNKGQIRPNWISHLFMLHTNFPGHQFLAEHQCWNGRSGTVFALRICRPPSWMRERVRLRIKSRPGDIVDMGQMYDVSGQRSKQYWLYYGTCLGKGVKYTAIPILTGLVKCDSDAIFDIILEIHV